MNLESIVTALGDTRREYKDVRLIEGHQTIDGQLYSFKAYTIGEPQNIIRIDLKKSSKE